MLKTVKGILRSKTQNVKSSRTTRSDPQAADKLMKLNDNINSLNATFKAVTVDKPTRESKILSRDP